MAWFTLADGMRAKSWAESLELGFDLIEQANEAKPSLQVVPEPARVRSMEIARMFAELEGHMEFDPSMTFFAAGEKNEPWGDGSYYELEDRLAYISRQCGRNVSSDFTWAKWRRMLECFEWRCAYCGRGEELGQDHVRDVRRGGSDRMRNILPACQACMRAKSEYDSPLDTWLRARGKKFRDAALLRIESGRSRL